MLPVRDIQTTVVWSFGTSSFNDQLINTISKQERQTLRLVSDAQGLAKLSDFCGKLKKLNNDSSIMVELLARSTGSIKNLKDPLELKFSQKVTITDTDGDGDLIISVESWSNLFASNCDIYFGNGSVVLKPINIGDGSIEAEVIQGGSVTPDMEVHVPGTRKYPSSERLLKDLKPLDLTNVDFLVIPATEKPISFEKVVGDLDCKGVAPWIFLRVETEYVANHLLDYLPLVKGVLISRIDLALNSDPAKVPMMTKEIIQLCNDHSKIVLVASDILWSMRHNATPTRAEVSDIANAVFDGADGVVLSDELPRGKYAVRGLELASKTIVDAESMGEDHDSNWVKHDPEVTDILACITMSAYRTAQRNKAQAIVCLTKAGNTALHLASYKTSIPIIAVTLSDQVCRRLRLVRGVVAVKLEETPQTDDILQLINDKLVREEWLVTGDKIVFVSVTLSSVGKDASNLFTVQTIV
ncbi:MAG: hypothetical protein CMP10_15405 [Zetaproteobacteria bacterium]|nr:hypothetical protein [Pseudobdellovibrionaceae bacterium]